LLYITDVKNNLEKSRNFFFEKKLKLPFITLVVAPIDVIK